MPPVICTSLRCRFPWAVVWPWRLGIWTCCRRRGALCCRRPRKEKDGEAENDIELGSSQDRRDIVSITADRTDGSQLSPGEVPGWQMPQLVVASSQRPGARIHKGTSLILPEAGENLIACIVASLPVLLQIRPKWQLGYSMAIDGVSLRTLYRQLSEAGPCILMLEDSGNCILGAFLAEGLRPGSQCYSSHECFVFRYPRTAGAWRTQVFTTTAAAAATPPALEDRQEGKGPSSERSLEFEALRKCQDWTGTSAPSAASVFCDHTGIVIGIDGPALFIDQDLLRGVSWPSAAFGSPSLAGAGPDFVVRNLEVWHWANR